MISYVFHICGPRLSSYIPPPTGLDYFPRKKGTGIQALQNITNREAHLLLSSA